MNSTADRAALTAWFVMMTAPRTELSLWKLLQDDEEVRRNLLVDDAYCPIETYSVWLYRKRHPIVRARPLTPGYVFIRCASPYLALHGLVRHGARDFVYGAQIAEPARISESALHAVKMREAEIAMKQARRTDRSKREIRKGSKIKAGDRLAIPHLGLDVPNQRVERVEGNYAETVAPNGMRIRTQLADLETA